MKKERNFNCMRTVKRKWFWRKEYQIKVGEKTIAIMEP
jgi:hypothetical protein